MKRWLMASVVMAVIAASPMAQAQGPGGGGPKGEKGGCPAMGLQMLLNNPDTRSEIGITDEQAEKISALLFDQQKAMVQLRANEELARIELRQLMSADGADQAAVLAAVEKAGLARIEIEKAQVAGKLQVKAILGAEKADALKKCISDRGAEHRDRRRSDMRRSSRDRRGRGTMRGPTPGTPPPMRAADDDDDDDDDGGDDAPPPED